MFFVRGDTEGRKWEKGCEKEKKKKNERLGEGNQGEERGVVGMSGILGKRRLASHSTLAASNWKIGQTKFQAQ